MRDPTTTYLTHLIISFPVCFVAGREHFQVPFDFIIPEISCTNSINAYRFVRKSVQTKGQLGFFISCIIMGGLSWLQASILWSFCLCDLMNFLVSMTKNREVTAIYSLSTNFGEKIVVNITWTTSSLPHTNVLFDWGTGAQFRFISMHTRGDLGRFPSQCHDSLTG